MVFIKYIKCFFSLKVQPLVWPVQGGTLNLTTCFCIRPARFPITHSLPCGITTATGCQSGSGWVSICLLQFHSCICASIYIKICSKFALQKRVKLIITWDIPCRSAAPAALSPRVRRRELYREIRSHIWGSLGKRHMHGWSTPLASAQVCRKKYRVYIRQIGWK